MRLKPLLLTIAAVCLTAGSCRYFYPEYQFRSAEGELNRLYAAHRPFAYRWPGAPWSPRAAGPPARVESDLLIPVQHNLHELAPAHSADPRWLRLSARVSLLLGQYDTAVTQYRSALLLSKRPDRDLFAEAASAYALRAEFRNHAADFGPALENISLALDRPDIENDKTLVSAVTHFNAGAILRQAWLLRTSAEQWKAAALGEKDKGWKSEAGEAEEALHRLFEKRDAAIARLNDAAQLNDVDLAMPAGLEIAQQAALERWISATPQPREALERIAREFKEKHGDLWWTDFLAARSTPEALGLLSKAEVANAAGRHAEALKAGADAEDAFRRLGNHAGRIRAHWDRIYASQQGDRFRDCSGLLNGFEAEFANLSYPWLLGTLWLETVTCRTILDMGATFEDAELAFRRIGQMKFEGLSLRALYNVTTPIFSSRIPQLTWARDLDGLSRYWRSAVKEYRLQSFGWSLSEIAVTAGQRAAAVMAMGEAVANIEHSPDRAFGAQVLSALAANEAMAGLFQHADGHLTRADQIRETSASGSPDRYRIRGEIERAHAQLAAGQAKVAVAALEKLLAALLAGTTATEEVNQADLQNTLGLGLLRMGRYQEAGQRFSESLGHYAHILSGSKDKRVRESVTAWYNSAFRGLTEARLRSGGSAATAFAALQALRRARRPGVTLNDMTVQLGSAILGFAVLPGGVSAWWIDSRGVEQRWADLAAVRAAATILSGLAPDPGAPPKAIRTAARQLGEMLLDPFTKQLSDLAAPGLEPVLFIDADDFLAGIPWSLVENLKGEPLIQRYSIVRTLNPGGTPRKRPAISVSSRAAVFADPALGEDQTEFPPLADAREEGRRVAKRFQASNLYEGPGATVDAFLSMAPQAQVLHFEGHGMSNGGFGALVLSGKPPLIDAERISGLNLSQLNLAVLAGCSTGFGSDTGSANADTLVRGFLDSGAARVLAASWDTDAFAASRLIEHFYDEVLGGATAALALRRAMLALRSQSSTAHPSAWAAFQLYGEP